MIRKPSLKMTLSTGLAILFKGRYSLTFDQLRFAKDNIHLKQRLRLLSHSVRFLAKAPFSPGIPPIVQLEPLNVCNLGCLTCPTGTGLMQRRPSIMPFETFRHITDQIKDHAVLLVFWAWGEPFMNIDAPRITGHSTANVHTVRLRNESPENEKLFCGCHRE